MPFAYPRTRSLNPIGKPCKISGVLASGLSKRQASIHLTIRAVGEQVVPPVLILRGLGRAVDPTEFAHYLGLENIKGYYQPKAWCDTHFFQWYLTEVFNPAVRETGELRDQLLCLDNLTAHDRSSSIELMKELGIQPFYLAAHCTDVAAPVDHHVGALLKLKIRELYEANLEVPGQFDLWRGEGDIHSDLSTAHRRCLMATWLNGAWASMKHMQSFFLSAFTSTGCLMKKNGRNLVKMRGLPGLG